MGNVKMARIFFGGIIEMLYLMLKRPATRIKLEKL